MIMADKIILGRKKNGWSQEELADKLHVTRQAVSKWEGASATPDLQRILEMSNLFGVSVDYLVRDEIEAEETDFALEELVPAVRRVSMEEADEFLRIKKETAHKIALGVMLCIVSPICLFILVVCSELGLIPLSEDAAGGIGMMVLLAIVAAACAVFMMCGAKTKPYLFLDNEVIATEHGVTGMVEEQKRKYQSVYTKYNILGVVTCMISMMVLFAGAFFDGREMIEVICFCLMLGIVAIGVRFFVIAGITQSSFEKLLQEGDYSVQEKTRPSAAGTVAGAVSAIYWLVVTAVFLILGFTGREWGTCGLIWPIAGVLFPVVLIITRMIERNREE